MNETDHPKTPRSKHYRIRKEIIWLGILSLCGYVAMDWWMHLNWPPYGEKNPEQIKSLNCKLHQFTIPDSLTENTRQSSQNSFTTDKGMFFSSPQCAAYIYLKFENSGMRLTQTIYDTEKKRRTATIVTTFDKYED